MGGVLIVDAAKVYTVSVGSSVALKHSSEASHGIWREIKPESTRGCGRARIFSTVYIFSDFPRAERIELLGLSSTA